MKISRRKSRAAFLDRDGVIVGDVHYLCRPDQLRLLPGAARAIRRLRRAGFKAVVVSNQSGVARGYLTLKDLQGIHRRLDLLLRSRGARLDGVYYCPHHPRIGRKGRCLCRKPKIGMLKAAARKLDLDLESCYVIGDTTTDIRTARNAGCRALLVRTGQAGKDGRYKAKPDRVFRDLAEAADWIVKAEGRVGAS